MTTLVDHYNEELRYLRQGGAIFARENPQVAARLGWQGDKVTDPFVEQLLEGLAFLTARIHARMDREGAEFAQQALARLAPAYCRVIPSITCFSFRPARGYCGVRFELLAHSDSVIVHIPFRIVLAALSQQPRLWLDFGGRLIDQSRRLATSVAGQGEGSALSRLAWVLASQIRQERDANVAIRLSQEDLGSLARLCRQTTNLTLRRLERSGAIRLAYGRIFVLDRACLCKLASGEAESCASLVDADAVRICDSRAGEAVLAGDLP